MCCAVFLIVNLVAVFIGGKKNPNSKLPLPFIIDSASLEVRPGKNTHPDDS